MRPIQAAAFELAIAKPRLDSYRGYFHASLEEAIGLYMWNMELSSCLSALLCHFEITLRNNVHRSMSQFYSRGTASSINWYDQIAHQLTPALRDKLSDVRRRHRGGAPGPGPDEMVSRLTFGFWPGVIGRIDRRYVDQLLPSIFPHHALNTNPAQWRAGPSRLAALAYLNEFNTMRNRLAHHEPVWKFAPVQDPATSPTHRLPGTVDLPTSLARFRRLLAQYDVGINSLNRDLALDIATSSWRQRMNFLLSGRGVERYRQGKHVPAAPISPATFRRSFDHLIRNNQIVVIAGGVKYRGIFTPG